MLPNIPLSSEINGSKEKKQQELCVTTVLQTKIMYDFRSLVFFGKFCCFFSLCSFVFQVLFLVWIFVATLRKKNKWALQMCLYVRLCSPCGAFGAVWNQPLNWSGSYIRCLKLVIEVKFLFNSLCGRVFNLPRYLWYFSVSCLLFNCTNGSVIIVSIINSIHLLANQNSVNFLML